MTETRYIIKDLNDIQIIKSIFSYKNINLDKNYIGKISIKPNEEYYWDYNNYFKGNKFIKPYDILDWIVIGPSKHKNPYKLSEGDFIKLGKLVFYVRKIKSTQNENLNETKRNSSFDSSEMNLGNNINEDIIIHNKNKNENYNYIDTNNELIENGTNKINNINFTSAVNDKLKLLYNKLKSVNKKQKTYRCRICFCEGNFEGLNPLISPCKCIGSVKYIHLNCLRKWLTSKITTKVSPTNDIYCYVYKSLKCEICQSPIPEIAEFRGKFISLLDFKNIESPYIILQSMYQYNCQNKNVSDLNIIFVISLKSNNYVNIGRANNSNIRLSDVSVSRLHAKITYNDGDFYIDDRGSKFGTLLLIQNNVLFLPNKDISIQNGKNHFIFKLRRTCLGLLKCYNNSLYQNKLYLESFLNSEKKVYSQILESFNNNIIDPIEKYSTVSGSCTPSKRSNETIEENKINETISDVKELNDEEKSENKNELNENVNLNLSNGIKINKILIESNNIKEDNNYNNYEYNDSIPALNLNLNKLKKEIIIESDKKIEEFDEQKKQNESREMLFNEGKNNDDNNFGKKMRLSSENMLNILNKKYINKKSSSVINKANTIGGSLIINNFVNKNNDLANTERGNNKVLENKEEKK